MGWTFLKHVSRVALTVGLIALCAVPAAAQSSSSARRWQVEGFAGLSLFDLPTDGTSSLPPAGAPLLTSGPTNPSRRVPTWFLGDGSNLLNGVNAEFGVVSRISPLDSALATLGLTGTNAPAFGLRVRRRVSEHLMIEFSADVMPGSRKLSTDLTNAVEASRTSFVSAFNGLLASGPFTNAAVTATSAIANQSSRDVATTVAAQWAFHLKSVTPYVSIGGGLVHKIGELPSVTLTGNYRFTVAGTVPINETDTLRLRYDQGSALVGLVGAGLRRDISDRLGFSVDGRLLLGQQTLSLRLDATPTSATGTPEGFIESFSTPAIQFSNSKNTGRESSLSGPGLNGYQAFATNGLQTRYIVSAGVFIRF